MLASVAEPSEPVLMESVASTSVSWLGRLVVEMVSRADISRTRSSAGSLHAVDCTHRRR